MVFPESVVQLNKAKFRMGDKVVSLVDKRPFFDLGKIMAWNPQKDEYWVRHCDEDAWIPAVALITPG